MRRLAQAAPQGRAMPTVLRLSDESESAVNLARPDAVGGSESSGGCLMITGYEGTPDQVARAREATTELLAGLGGESLGTEPGEAWSRGRFDGPYLRDSLLDVGVLVETFETVTFWSRLEELYAAVKGAVEADLAAQGTPPLVLCHISHVYETGASLYFTVAAKELDDGLGQWRSAKRGRQRRDDRRPAPRSPTTTPSVATTSRGWPRRSGPVGVEVLRAVKARLDPAGVLNPGILVP